MPMLIIFYTKTHNVAVFMFVKTQKVEINKQIHFVGERFILKIHRNTTNYSYIVDVSVSDRDRNVDNVRIIGCVSMNFQYQKLDDADFD